VADDQTHEAVVVLELLTRGHITYGWVSDFFCATYKCHSGCTKPIFSSTYDSL